MPSGPVGDGVELREAEPREPPCPGRAWARERKKPRGRPSGARLMDFVSSFRAQAKPVEPGREETPAKKNRQAPLGCCAPGLPRKTATDIIIPTGRYAT